jgi:hypothetical protein
MEQNENVKAVLEKVEMTEEEQNDILHMSEDEIIERLLNTSEEKKAPNQTVIFPRLGIPVVFQAVDEKVSKKLEKRCTTVNRNKETFDDEEYAYLMFVAGTKSPNWADSRLIDEFKASGPEQVVRRKFLPGEAKQGLNIILDLSGYGDDALLKVKNG